MIYNTYDPSLTPTHATATEVNASGDHVQAVSAFVEIID
jgi:hypothetical protein